MYFYLRSSDLIQITSRIRIAVKGNIVFQAQRNGIWLSLKEGYRRILLEEMSHELTPGIFTGDSHMKN